MNKIGVGVLGFGTVGAGVVRILQENGTVLAERLGVKPVLKRIADLDLKTDRGVRVDKSLLTRDAESVINDPDIPVIVELIGGTGVARKFILQALRAGKSVVTANKALLAEHGAEIFRVAAQNKTDIWFEASVGGGIPIIRSLREGLIANRIESIYGILNGTCNYILTRMEKEGLAFDSVLSEAQAMGYAEANPGLDIDGWDTAHKAVVLASLAYGFNVPMKSVAVEGIRGLLETDIQYARDFGYRIKLLAVIKQAEKGIHVRVYPALVPVTGMLASVSGVFNAIMVRGDFVGDTLYYGRGAGREPTASAVVGDIADAVRNLASGCPGRVPALARCTKPPRVLPAEEMETRYYIRLSLRDEPGVFSKIAAVLGRNGISIASVLQKEIGGRHVPVVILTHTARERSVLTALKQIKKLSAVGAEPVRLRIEE